MARIGILSGAASEGLTNVVAAINERREETGFRGVRIARQASVFRGRVDDLIVNWGRGSQNDYLDARVGTGKVLNKTFNVAKATNKMRSFQEMTDVSTVEWTGDRAAAQAWLDAGFPVYARTRLQGHSGEGIVVCSREELGDVGGIETSVGLVDAQLYTKGFNNQRREFRIHVMQGVPTYVQQKKRRENWREIAEYSNIVRNFHTGWIYATADIHPNPKALAESVKAIAALGLDFGAVDVITRGDDAWVLEVNTAPGNEGTNTQVYADNFIRIASGEAPLIYTARNRAADIANDQAMDVLAEQIADEVAPANIIRDGRAPVAPVNANRLQEAANILAQQAGAVPAPHNRFEDAARGRDEAPAPRQARVRPVAEVAEAVPAAERGQVNNIVPVDKKFYFLEINGEETVGQWTRQLNGFSVIGFAMSIPLADVVIKKVIE